MQLQLQESAWPGCLPGCLGRLSVRAWTYSMSMSMGAACVHTSQ